MDRCMDGWTKGYIDVGMDEYKDSPDDTECRATLTIQHYAQ